MRGSASKPPVTQIKKLYREAVAHGGCDLMGQPTSRLNLLLQHSVGLLAETRGTHGYSWRTLRVQFKYPMKSG